ncbi:MAG TPA: hypothetical protein VNJ71_11920 [Gemmatimonadales bacterium]|jgi:hypothetical protein|nr:hypothetical protein [Gemmatimonadales bacterium]
MKRRGFALVGSVWLLVLLLGIAAATSAAVRHGHQVSRNRLALTRTEWAREACVQIMLGRYRQAAARRLAEEGRGTMTAQIALDTVALGRGTWCSVSVEDPGTKLHLNRADPDALRRLLRDSARVNAILRERPLESVEQLAWLPQFDELEIERLRRIATVRGIGRVNLNDAAPEVIEAALGLSANALAALLAARVTARRLEDLRELAPWLASGDSGTTDLQYRALLALTTTAPEVLVVTVTGGLRAAPVRSQAVLTVVPLHDRLAVVRRETP